MPLMLKISKKIGIFGPIKGLFKTRGPGGTHTRGKEHPTQGGVRGRHPSYPLPRGGGELKKTLGARL